MKILFSADWHIHPRNYGRTLPALEAFIEHAQKNPPDAIIHGGDVFDTRGRLDPTSIAHVRATFARLRRIAPTIVIPGNHDAANAWGEIDSASGVLAGEPVAEGRHRLSVISSPGMTQVGGAYIAALPFPSKYHLLAQDEEQTKPTELLLIDTINGLAAQISKLPPAPTILVFHGSVAGAALDNDSMIGVGQDITLPREALESGPWDLVLAGHLHRAQEVGKVYYSGSLAQLTFAQAGYKPSFIELEIRDKGLDTSPKGNGGGRPYHVERIALPVAEPLVSIDIDTLDTDEGIVDGLDIEAEVHAALLDYEAPLRGRVRIKIRARPEELAAFDEDAVRGGYPDVLDWKIVKERVAPTRIRSDVGVEADVGELLGEWFRLNPIDKAIADLADKLAIEVEDTELEERKLEPQLLAYRPIETVFSDYKPFRGGRIPWEELPRITVIKGPNGSGKSKAALSEAAALFGPRALGAPLRKFVRNGQPFGAIEHLFEVGAGRYRIKRIVKLSSSGKTVTSAVSFAPPARLAPTDEEREAGLTSWESLNGADARETQKRIEAKVGSPEMFFSTRFARQNDIDRLLRMTPAERKTLLQEALQAGRFARLEAIARARGLSVKREVDKLRGAIERLRAESEHLDACRGDLAAAEESAQKVDEELAGLKGRRQEKAQKAEDLSKALVLLEARRDKIATAEEIAAQAELDVLTEEKALKAFRALLEAAPALEEKIEELAELRDQYRELLEKADEAREIESELGLAKNDLAGKERSRSRQIEALESDLREKEKRAALLGSVPCQDIDQELDRPEGREPLTVAGITRSCQFLQEAAAAKEELPVLLQGVETIKKDQSHIEGPVAKIKKLEVELGELDFDKKKLAAAQTRLETIDEGEINRQSQGLLQARAKAEEAERRLGDLEARKRVAFDTAKALGMVSAKDDADLRAKLTTAKTGLAVAQSALDRALEAQRVNERNIGIFQERVTIAERAGVELETMNQEVAYLEKGIQAAEILVGAFGRDGIPFLILERALPEIQSSMNSLLEGSPLAVEIDPVRDLETGKVRDEVNITFRDQNGEQVLEDASGYQANLLGVALRAAVAELEASRAGVRPEFFVIDEGFGAYDPDNIPHGREMIHRLADRFGKVVYITHVPEVQDAAEGELVVRPSADGSTIEEVFD